MEPQKNVAVVAPVQLGNAFMVLLQAESGIRPLACAANVEALHLTLAGEKPDVVLLYIDADSTGSKKGQVDREQVGQSRARWPDVVTIAVVKDSHLREEVEAIGADVVFNVGVTPERLLKTIETFDKSETAEVLTGRRENKTSHQGQTLEDQLKHLGGGDPWWKVWRRKKYAG